MSVPEQLEGYNGNRKNNIYIYVFIYFFSLDVPGEKSFIVGAFCLTPFVKIKTSPQQPRTFALCTVMALSLNVLLKTGL